MYTKLRTEAKNDFEKDFFKLMNNSDFGKTMENIRNHRDINLVTTDERRNKLVSEPNYHTTKYFSENVLAIEMKKTKIIMNKPAKLCYIGTDSFIIHIETEDFMNMQLMMWIDGLINQVMIKMIKDLFQLVKIKK